MLEAGALVFVPLPCRRGPAIVAARVIEQFSPRDPARWWLQVGPYRMLVFEWELLPGRPVDVVEFSEVEYAG